MGFATLFLDNQALMGFHEAKQGVECGSWAKPRRAQSPWAMGASRTAISRRVRPASAPAMGPGSRRSLRWDVTSWSTKRVRNGWKWSRESRACALSGHPPSACSPWYEGRGRLSTSHMGAAMGPSLRIARRGAVATCPKSWPRDAIPQWACDEGQVIRPWRQRAVGWLPSRYRRWLSSGLH
jgi:hypothetical protein